MRAARQTLIPQDRAGFYTNNFDLIRLLLALLVVWSHSFALFFGSEQDEPLSILTNGAYNAGNIGVWGFFVISGFLITASVERSASLTRYCGSRVRRIYPGYLAATSICAFVVTPIFAPPGFALGLFDVAATLGNNLLLGNHFPLPRLFADNPIHAINGSLWSIKFEFFCYAGAALLGLFAARMRRWVAIFAYVLVVAIWCWLDITGRRPGGSPIVFAAIGWPYRWFWVLPNFLAGMIAYLNRDRLPRSGRALIAALIACLAALHLGEALPAGIVAAHILVPPTMAYLILWIAYHPGIPGRHIARFGDFSYGTYLYAFVIQQILVATTALPFWPFVVLSMALSLLAGAASWHLVERHFLRSGNHPAEHRPL